MPDSNITVAAALDAAKAQKKINEQIKQIKTDPIHLLVALDKKEIKKYIETDLKEVRKYLESIWSQKPVSAQLQVDLDSLKAYQAKLAECNNANQAFESTMTKASAAAKQHVKNMSDAANLTESFRAEQVAAEAATKKTAMITSLLGNALQGLAVSLVNWGVQQLIGLLDNLFHAKQKQIEKARELREEYITLEAETQTLAKELETVNSRLEELQSQDKLRFVDLQELERLRETSEELRRQYEIKKNIADIAGAAAEAEAIQVVKDARVESRAYEHYFGPDLDISEYVDYFTAIEENLQLIREFQEDLNDPHSEYIPEQTKKLIEQYKTEIWAIMGELSEQAQSIQGYTQEGAELQQKIAGISDAVFNQLDFGTNLKVLLEDIPEVKRELELLATIGRLDESVIEGYEEFDELLKEFGADASQILEHFAGFEQEDLLGPLMEQMDQLQEAYQVLSGAVAEYNETEALSIDTYQRIMELGPEYIAQLFEEEGQLNLNEEALYGLMEAQIDEMAAKQALTLLNTVEQYGAEALALQGLEDASNETASSMWDLFQAQMANADLTEDQIAHIDRQVEHYKMLAEAAKASLRATREQSGSSQPSSGSTTSRNSATNTVKDEFTKLYEELKSQRDRDLIDQEQYLDRLYELNERYNRNNLELWQKYDQEIIEGRKALIAAEFDELERMEKAYGQAVIDSLDKRIAKLREEMQESDAYYDRKIARLKEQLSLMQEEWEKEDALLRIEKAREELERLKNQKTVQVYREGQGFVWEADQSAVTQAQNNLDGLVQDWERQQQKLSLQKQIDDLENAKRRNREAIEEQIKDIEELKAGWQDSIAQIGVALEEYNEGLTLAAEVERMTLAEMLAEHEAFTKRVIELAEQRRRAMEEVRSSSSKSKVAGHASGTTSTAPGLMLVGELGPELRVTKGGEGIIPANVTRRLWDLGLDPEGAIRKVLQGSGLQAVHFPQGLQGVSGGDVSLQIGDIHLSGVQNVDSLSDQIVRRLPGAVMQAIYKRS